MTDTVELSADEVARRAFLAAQQSIGNVAKTKLNPAFRGVKYVPLDVLTDAVNPVLNENDLFVTQGLTVYNGKSFVKTLVTHVNGTVVARSEYPVVAKDMEDPQKFGGGVTYARRYSLMSLLAITGDDDDDGNLAATPAAAPKVNDNLDRLKAELKKQGVTAATLPQAFEKRFDNPKKTTFASLQPTEIDAWLKDIEGVPF